MNITEHSLPFLFNGIEYTLRYKQTHYEDGVTSESNYRVDNCGHTFPGLSQHIRRTVALRGNNDITAQALDFGLYRHHLLELNLIGDDHIPSSTGYPRLGAGVFIDHVLDVFAVSGIIYFRMKRLPNRLYTAPVKSLTLFYHMLYDNLYYSPKPRYSPDYTLRFHNLPYQDIHEQI